MVFNDSKKINYEHCKFLLLLVIIGLRFGMGNHLGRRILQNETS